MSVLAVCFFPWLILFLFLQALPDTFPFLQLMEANKADWNVLFEPYPFFEAYKHYLEIDITAENEDDLRKWKGWVESRLRFLTLKVN